MNKDFETNWDTPVTIQQENTAAAPNKSSTAVKQIVTIRLDVDMLEWFKSEGPGYQTRINQVLRDHMNTRRGEETAKAA